MEKVIAVISGKGGVSKTTLTANVGLAIKRFGREVTVLDGDMSNSNLGLQLVFPVSLRTTGCFERRYKYTQGSLHPPLWSTGDSLINFNEVH